MIKWTKSLSKKFSKDGYSLNTLKKGSAGVKEELQTLIGLGPSVLLLTIRSYINWYEIEYHYAEKITCTHKFEARYEVANVISTGMEKNKKFNQSIIRPLHLKRSSTLSSI